MKCTVVGCDSDIQYKEKGLCQKHYFRVWRFRSGWSAKDSVFKPGRKTINRTHTAKVRELIGKE